MKPYFFALICLATGVVAGTLIYQIFFPPSSPMPRIILPAGNQSGQPDSALTGDEINLTLIEAPGCAQCDSNLREQIAGGLLNAGISTGNENSLALASPEAQALIQKYGISYLPAMILSGPIAKETSFVSDWTQNMGSLENDGSLVSRPISPPFYDIGKKEMAGLVKAIMIRASGCPQCTDPSVFITTLEGPGIGMMFSEKKSLDENDADAQSLISKYNITKLPVLLLSTDASVYPAYDSLLALGSEQDGWYVLRTILPPYENLDANRSVVGLVNAVFIINKSCTGCFDIKSLSDYIADSSGMVIGNETSYDTGSAEGRALIAKYSIASIPALIYSPDASYYPGFEDIWKNQNSTIESDGSFVFRAYDLLENVTYQNISG